jgi:hypothetical protein
MSLHSLPPTVVVKGKVHDSAKKLKKIKRYWGSPIDLEFCMTGSLVVVEEAWQSSVRN